MRNLQQITTEVDELYLTISKRLQNKVKYIKSLEDGSYEIRIKKIYKKDFEKLKVKIQKNAEKRANGGFEIFFYDITIPNLKLPF
jgi:hypothetical protein